MVRTGDWDRRDRHALIENKVDAMFQHRQAARYEERAAGYLAQGACSRALTVLVAPKSYLESGTGEHGFDRSVAYETILEWFDTAHDLGSRARYKGALLTAAISRGGIGWKLVPDERVSTFWEEYWRLASALAPELRMPRPPASPAPGRQGTPPPTRWRARPCRCQDRWHVPAHRQYPLWAEDFLAVHRQLARDEAWQSY